MTNTERKALVDQLLPDNTTGEISAKDVRDVQYQFSDDIEVAAGNATTAINRINDLGLQVNNGKLDSQMDIDVPKQTIPPDPVAIEKDNRLITVSNAFEIEKALKEYTDQHLADLETAYKAADSALESDISSNSAEVSNLGGNVAANEAKILKLDTRVSDNTSNITTLDGKVTTNKTDIATLDGKVTANTTDITDLKAPKQEYKLVGGTPKMVMEVDGTNGVGANMEVKYGQTVAAQMQWHASSEDLQFDLMDKSNGAVKATWQLKPDGHAYVGGKQVLTEDYQFKKPVNTAVRLYMATDVFVKSTDWKVIPFDARTITRGATADKTTNTITLDADAPHTYYRVHYGINAQIPSGEGIEVVLFKNDHQYDSETHKLSDSGFTFGSTPGDENMYWESYVQLSAGDKLDLRVKSGKTDGITIKLTRLVFGVEEV